MVVGFIVYSGAIVSATPITIDLVDGDWVNGAPSANVTIVNSGTTGGLSTARWGASGYDFSSRTTGFLAPTDGSAFLLGDFTHWNYPIPAGTSINSIDLDLELGNVFSLTTTFNFLHDETPNTGGADASRDIVTIANPILNAEFSDLTDTYYFNLIGFSQDGGATIADLFRTYENQQNTAGLYATITSEPINPVPEPTTMMLFGIGILGLAGVCRRKS